MTILDQSSCESQNIVDVFLQRHRFLVKLAMPLGKVSGGIEVVSYLGVIGEEFRPPLAYTFEELCGKVNNHLLHNHYFRNSINSRIAHLSQTFSA